MKLRKRPEVKIKVVKKDKTAASVKNDKHTGDSVKKKRKSGTDQGKKKKKASNKKITDTLEIIEIPPVEQCAVNDVALALEDATKEELGFAKECSLIFECNMCESFFRTIDSYLNHKLSFCIQSSHGRRNGDTTLVKEEIHEELQPSTIGTEMEHYAYDSDY